MGLSTLRSSTVIAVLGTASLLAQTPGETGTLRNEPDAWQGYTMFSPSNATTTYLIDMDGEVVHTWHSDSSGGPGYLLADGSLLRKESVPNPVMRSGGFGGRITRYAWDSTVLWRYEIATGQSNPRHTV